MQQNNAIKGKHSANKIQISSFDDLFGVNDTAKEYITDVLIADLHTFKNHPFRVVDDQKMTDLINSIKERGVLVPGIVRPRNEGGYELVAGHRRAAASQALGLNSMKVMVQNLDDDEATIIMVDSNIQRENLLYSEKAFAFKMKFEALKHSGCKSGKLTTVEIGEEVGESGRQIQRYIRLTELIKPLLDMVDENKLGFIPAVDLSYLTNEEQIWVFNKVLKNKKGPTGEQALKLKKHSIEFKLTLELVEEILSEVKTEKSKFVIPADRISRYFPKDYSKKDIEDVIYKLLEGWKKSQYGRNV